MFLVFLFILLYSIFIWLIIYASIVSDFFLVLWFGGGFLLIFFLVGLVAFLKGLKPRDVLQVIMGVLFVFYPSILVFAVLISLDENAKATRFALLLNSLLDKWSLALKLFGGFLILLLVLILLPTMLKRGRDVVFYRVFGDMEGDRVLRVTFDRDVAEIFGFVRVSVGCRVFIDRVYRLLRTLDTIVSGYMHCGYKDFYWGLRYISVSCGDRRLNSVVRSWNYYEDKYLPYIRFVPFPAVGIFTMFLTPLFGLFLLGLEATQILVRGGDFGYVVESLSIIFYTPITYTPLIALVIYCVSVYFGGWYYFRAVRGHECLVGRAKIILEAIISILPDVLSFKFIVALTSDYNCRTIGEVIRKGKKLVILEI